MLFLCNLAVAGCPCHVLFHLQTLRSSLNLISFVISYQPWVISFFSSSAAAREVPHHRYFDLLAKSRESAQTQQSCVAVTGTVTASFSCLNCPGVPSPTRQSPHPLSRRNTHSSGYKHRVWSQDTWLHVTSPRLTSKVSSSKSLHLPEFEMCTCKLGVIK